MNGNPGDEGVKGCRWFHTLLFHIGSLESCVNGSVMWDRKYQMSNISFLTKAELKLDPNSWEKCF